MNRFVSPRQHIPVRLGIVGQQQNAAAKKRRAAAGVARQGQVDQSEAFAALDRSDVDPTVSEGGVSGVVGQRLRNAMTARAYGDHTLTDALAETGDPRTRVLASALEQAAPDMARLRMGVERGEVDPSVDLSPHVSQALAALRVARDQRIPLADVVQQGDAFSRMSPQARDLLHVAYGPELTGRMSAGHVAELLSQYARAAGQQTTEARLFGENLNSS